MTRDELLDELAQKAYNISYSANLNFSTYDLYNDITKYVSFISFLGGILSLVYPEYFGTKLIATLLCLLGVVGIYVEQFTNSIDSYVQRGVADTQRLNKLRTMYFQCKEDTSTESVSYPIEYEVLLEEFYNQSEAKQLILSGWFAHFKMFSQKKYEHRWIEEQLGLRLWADKLPSSFKVFLSLVLIGGLMYCFSGCPRLQALWTSVRDSICM